MAPLHSLTLNSLVPCQVSSAWSFERCWHRSAEICKSSVRTSLLYQYVGTPAYCILLCETLDAGVVAHRLSSGFSRTGITLCRAAIKTGKSAQMPSRCLGCHWSIQAWVTTKYFVHPATKLRPKSCSADPPGAPLKSAVLPPFVAQPNGMLFAY